MRQALVAALALTMATACGGGGSSGSQAAFCTELAKDKRTFADTARGRYWEDMQGADALVAYRAFWDLQDSPAQAVALFRDKLKPDAPPDPAKVAQWVRDLDHPYGFAAFTVDPGRRPGDTTTMHVTYYNVNKPNGDLSVFEKFSLHRKRSDG